VGSQVNLKNLDTTITKMAAGGLKGKRGRVEQTGTTEIQNMENSEDEFLAPSLSTDSSWRSPGRGEL